MKEEIRHKYEDLLQLLGVHVILKALTPAALVWYIPQNEGRLLPISGRVPLGDSRKEVGLKVQAPTKSALAES